MDLLEPVSADASCELHRLSGAVPGVRERLILSTPQTRAICNQPEIVGGNYTRQLREAMEAGLSALSSGGHLPSVPEEQHCVLTFLRGGLNFGLREALQGALGIQRSTSSFLSSQREQVDGVWSIAEDSYRKLSVPDQAVLYCGDVVATGVTLAHGFQTLLQHLEAEGHGLRRIVFFTIGGPRIEEVLAGLHSPLLALCSAYEGATIVYLEARFVLAEAASPLRIALPGTDLLRTGALLAPSFAASQWDAVAHPLERCSIYDAGSRAFDVPAYLGDVRSYWRAVASLAAEGWSLADALSERWPAWEQSTWQIPGGHAIRSPDALAAVAIDRLERLR